MNTLMQMAPMMVEGGGPPPPHQPPPPPMMHHHHQFPHGSQHQQQQQQQQQQQPAPLSSSMNRSQRCGVCRGCQCKPCGQCTYCQDSPQFGGPGVKKQSCIERRCLRVLENRLQRDAPTFKARVGCNQCEDCRQNDCQVCLVCLDKRFFENRYMRGAMCAKKRCNNATSIELPPVPQAPVHDYQQQQQQQHRQAVKRSYEQMTPQMQQHFDMKRRVEMQYMGMQQQPQQQQVSNGLPPTGVLSHHLQPPPPPQQQQPQQLPPPQNGVQEHQQQQQQQQQRMMIPVAYSDVIRMEPMQQAAMTVIPQGPMMQNSQQQQQNQQQQQQQPLDVPAYIIPSFMHTQSHMEFYPTKVYALDEFEQNGDPFIPPSYAPDMKNAVVLQPL